MLLLVRLFLNALAVMVVAYLVPGVSVASFPSAFIAAIVIGLVNALIRPFVEVLSLPLTIFTLGLFSFVVNALMFWLAAKLVPGFDVAGFWPAFWGALVFWIVSWLTNTLITDSLDKTLDKKA